MLFEALASAARRQVRNFKLQGLANVAWAFAIAPVQLLMPLATIAEQRIGSFEMQEFANTAFEFPIAGMLAPDLLDPTLLVLESQEKWIVKLEKLVKEHGISAVESWRDMRETHQHHLIHLAVAQNYMEVVRVMIQRLGFDPNIPRISDGCTPLHLAIWLRYPEMARLLI